MLIDGSAWNKPACVIVACGSFSPPTFLHLRIMEEAKICVGSKYEIIGGILSPVNDHYGELHKPSLKAANGQHRVSMCNSATQSSQWIGVSDFEVSLDKWTRTAVVLEAYSKALNHHYVEEGDNKENGDSDDVGTDKQLRVFMVCGSDLLHSMKKPNVWLKEHQEILLSQGLVVCQRDGDELDDAFFEDYDLFKKYRDSIHTFKPTVKNTISSSKLREQIKKNGSIKYLTEDAVIGYIEKEKLYR